MIIALCKHILGQWPTYHFQLSENVQNLLILIPPGLALNWFHSQGTREISRFLEFFFLTVSNWNNFLKSNISTIFLFSNWMSIK